MDWIEAFTKKGEELVSARATSRVAYDIGRELYDRGQFEEAAQQFIRSIRAYPLDPDPYMWLGECHWIQDDGLAAEEQYEKCLQHEPSDNSRAHVLQRLGLAAERGDHRTAAAFFDEANALRADLEPKLVLHGVSPEHGEWIVPARLSSEGPCSQS